MLMASRSSITVLLACAAAVCAPVAAVAQSPQELLGYLNAQRVANGLPPVSLAADLTDGCAKHAEYMRINGPVAHGEDPALPGYTPEGADPGAVWEVLAGEVNPPWSQTLNPWVWAPLHELALMDPNVTEVGLAAAGGKQCGRMRHGRAFAVPALFSLPGPGARDVPTGFSGHWEVPFAPQELVGFAQSRETGPQVILWLAGAEGAVVDSASLTGPSGPVAVRVADSRARHTSGGGLPDGSAVLVVEDSLQEFADYTGQVQWSSAAGPVTQQIAFRTAGRANHVRVSGRFRAGRGWTFTVSSDAPSPRFELRGPAGQVVPVAVRGRSASTGALEPGVWQACASSGGESAGYSPAQTCQAVTQKPALAAKITRRAGRVQINLTPASVLAGRTVQVTIGRRARTVKAHGSLRFAAPRGRQKVTVKTAAFTRAGTRFPALRVVNTIR